MSSPSSKTTRDRRAFLATALLGVSAGIPAVASAGGQPESGGAGSKFKIRGINPPDAPAADVGYTPGILAEGQRLLFISGQGPRDYDANMETQFRQTFERIKVILEQAGGSMKNLVILRAYFVHFARDLPVCLLYTSDAADE